MGFTNNRKTNNRLDGEGAEKLSFSKMTLTLAIFVCRGYHDKSLCQNFLPLDNMIEKPKLSRFFNASRLVSGFYTCTIPCNYKKNHVCRVM